MKLWYNPKGLGHENFRNIKDLSNMKRASNMSGPLHPNPIRADISLGLSDHP